MLKGYEKIRIPDENKEKDFMMEVNWNPYDKMSNECKLVRFTFPGGETSIVKREHLLSALFRIGSADDQRAMVPQKVERIRNYQTVLGITAKKDIQKGEKINVRVSIPIPTQSEEVIRDLKREVLKKGLDRY